MWEYVRDRLRPAVTDSLALLGERSDFARRLRCRVFFDLPVVIGKPPHVIRYPFFFPISTKQTVRFGGLS